MRMIRRNLRALWRDTRVLIGQFRVSLLLFAALICVGTLSLYALYPDGRGSGDLDWVQSLYHAITLIFFQCSLDFPSAPILQIMFFIIPPIGLGVVVEGILRFSTALFNRRERKEAWQVAIASTYRDHIVVCGLGRVGYQVVRVLLRLGEDVVGVEHNAECEFLDELRQMGVPVLLGDARQAEMLEQARVQDASAIVVCTEDDLSNLAIALGARELNPGIKVVMRMFDGQLAQKVRSGFGIHTAFSTSALAAPVFAAAATRAQIDHSFYVDDLLMNVARATIDPSSTLVGYTIGQLEHEFDVSVILYRGSDTLDLHPSPDITLQGNDHLMVFSSLEALAHLQTKCREQAGAGQDVSSVSRRSWLDRLLRREKPSTR
jgi:voltage-gated potassium channel